MALFLPSTGSVGIAQNRDRIAVVGDLGSLQLITGDEVNAVDLPLDIDLLGVHMAVDGRILIAGRDGICAEVSNGELLTTEIEAPNSTFFSVTQFKGATYWGDENFGVFTQKGATLVPEYETGMGFDMRSDGDFLYCSRK